MSYTLDATRAEMREHVQTVAGLSPKDSRKAALQFAANVLQLPFARVKAYFYGEARHVPAHEADMIRAYVKASEDLLSIKAEYETRCEKLVADARPVLARLAPPPISGKTAAACREASEVVARRTLTKAARSSDDGSDE